MLKVLTLMDYSIAMVILCISFCQVRKLEKLVGICLEMHRMSPESNYPLEWICKVYLEWASGTLGNLGILKNIYCRGFMDFMLATN